MSILVSITCTTYNHERYIAQAIEGFLMQKTDFEYEILIHDDASTDGTGNIIREYESKYPHIIKPIYQTENQYSIGIKNIVAFILPQAQGKYIALCDGDDYWTDPQKLQKQANYMEDHPDCSVCFHAVKVVKNNRKSSGQFIKPYDVNRLVPVEDIIIGGGRFIGTNSMFFPKKYLPSLPEFFWQAPVGDFPLVLYLAIQGTVYYFNEVMSSYRTNVTGSWTSRLAASKDMQIKLRTGLIKMINEFNQYTDYRYADSVEVRQVEYDLLLLIAEGNVKRLKEEKYRRYREELGIYVAAMIYLNKYCPSLYYKLRVYYKYLITKIDIRPR